MKTDAELKTDVQAALADEWKFDIADVRGIVEDGVVTLTGTVRCPRANSELQQAAQRVPGVRAVVNTLSVKLLGGLKLADDEVARAAEIAIGSNSAFNQQVEAAVDNGWVTLTGTVPWPYQKEEAEDAIRRLSGIRGVTNDIILKPAVSEAAVEMTIESALQHRDAQDAKAIRVSTEGTQVTLEGRVHSSAEKKDAEKAAWATPGVTTVYNQLVVA